MKECKYVLKCVLSITIPNVGYNECPSLLAVAMINKMTKSDLRGERNNLVDIS